MPDDQSIQVDDEPDYTLIEEDPPEQQPPHRAAPMLDNLTAVMVKPGQSHRVAAYKTAKVASVTASAYRLGKRKLPPGLWEFTSGPTSDGRFGLWATYLGPERWPGRGQSDEDR